VGIPGGTLKALRGKTVAIQPLSVDLAEYDVIKLYSPIWGGNTHPAFNAALELLPQGKVVEVTVVSGSGTSKCRERIAETVEKRGCDLTEFRDVKAGKQ
jgi:hypothetical protein